MRCYAEDGEFLFVCSVDFGMLCRDLGGSRLGESLLRPGKMPTVVWMSLEIDQAPTFTLRGRHYNDQVLGRFLVQGFSG